MHRCRAWDSIGASGCAMAPGIAMETDDATCAYLDNVAGAVACGVSEHDHTATDLQSPLYAACR